MEDHIVFGISPFNTKFNKEYINNMLEWGFSNFKRVDIIHPHEEAKYLLMGCGKDEVKSIKKSRKEYVRVKKIIEFCLNEKDKKLSYGEIIKGIILEMTLYHLLLMKVIMMKLKNWKTVKLSL